MAESFLTKRRKELGIGNNDKSVDAADKNVSFLTRRRIELGIGNDVLPSTKLRNELPETIKNARTGNFMDTTLGQSGINPAAQSIISSATGIKAPFKPSMVQPTAPPSATTTGTSGNYTDIYNQRKAEIADGGTARSFFGNGIYDNVIAPFATGANYLAYGNPLGALVSRTGNSAASLTGPAVAPKPSVGIPLADKTADVLGTIAGFGFNPAGVGVAGQGLISAPYKIADQTLSKGLGGYIAKSAANAIENPKTAKLVTTGLTNAYRGTIAGGITGGATSLLRGESSGEEVGSSALLGAALGGIGDAAFGAIAESLFSRLMRQNGIKGAEQSEILGLPASRKETRINTAQQRSTLAPNTEPVVNPYTFGLPEATPGTLQRNTQFNQSVSKLQGVTSELEALQTKHAQNIITEYQSLKTVRNTKGKKPDWYREIVSTTGKPPTNRQLFELAGQRVVPGKDLEQAYLKLQQSELRQQSQRLDPSSVTTDAPLSLNRLSTNVNGQIPKINEPKVRKQSVVNPTSIKADDYHMINDVDTPIAPVIDNVPTPQRANDIPATQANSTVPTAPIAQQRGFVSTLANSEKTPNAFTEQLRQSDSATYEPITNEATLNLANGRLGNIETARVYVMSKSKFTAEKAATAQRLIDHYNSRGQTDAAVEVAEKLSEEATNAGQFIQALSMYNRLSPEGTLKFINNRVDAINDKLPTRAKKVVVTDETKQSVMELATASQKMTGIKTLSNDVIDIVTKAKNGEKLSDADTDALQRFVSETQTFVKDASKRTRSMQTPRLSENVRKRDQIASFLDAQETAARERIEARRNRLSSTPLDVWADYSIIGASKMAKGTIKFADWSEEMVKELGEDIRPILPSLYDRATETFGKSKNKVTQIESDNNVKLVNKIIRDRQLTGQDADSLLITARKVAVLSGEEKKLASQDLQKILQSFDKPGIGRKLSSLQTTAQLLNPKTQVRNVIGNELFYRTERLNKLIATPLDIARSKITGGERYVTFKTNNQGEFWSNWMKGAKAGWNGTNINGLQSQFDLSAPAFKGKYNPMTYMEKALGASLRSFDNAAYMRAYNNTLGEMGTLDAINKGIKGQAAIKEHVQNYIVKASDDVTQLADNYGRYITFQDNNALSMGLSRFKRALNFQKDFGAGDLILKYPKTPGALLMRALEYSPAGFIRSASLINKGLRYAEKDKLPEAALAVSRAILGTVGFAGMGYALMDNGVLTTAASKDRDIRALAQSAGQSDYQINFSALGRYIESGFKKQEPKAKEGDILYTYDWAQPIALSLSVGAEANKNIKEGKEAEKLIGGIGMTAINSLSGGLNTLTEQSVLRGLKDAAQGYPGQTFADKLFEIIGTLPPSFIPTLSNQIRQTNDNTKREVYSSNIIDKSFNQTINRIPGLEKKLPAKFDSLGQQAQNYQDPSLFNIFVNPGELTRYKLSPNAQMVMDLINETDDESLAPRVPTKSIQGNKLTGEQFSRLSELQGGLINEGISNLNPDYPSNIKAKVLDRLYDQSGKTARKQLFEEFKLKDNREK
ncbi:hypothetical protein ACFSGI_09055 [Paenibacillus nicotianae]|uniref:Large polyvalent protein associated domain-containing protein n=1 Tax=Paenibacillus nicotianae TaxID=1526551 RepID=A0ABW4UUG4_9BACL